MENNTDKHYCHICKKELDIYTEMVMEDKEFKYHASCWVDEKTKNK